MKKVPTEIRSDRKNRPFVAGAYFGERTCDLLILIRNGPAMERSLLRRI